MHPTIIIIIIIISIIIVIIIITVSISYEDKLCRGALGPNLFLAIRMFLSLFEQVSESTHDGDIYSKAVTRPQYYAAGNMKVKSHENPRN